MGVGGVQSSGEVAWPGLAGWWLHDAGMEEGAYWASIDCSGAPSEETSSQPDGHQSVSQSVRSLSAVRVKSTSEPRQSASRPLALLPGDLQTQPDLPWSPPVTL